MTARWMAYIIVTAQNLALTWPTAHSSVILTLGKQARQLLGLALQTSAAKGSRQGGTDVLTAARILSAEYMINMYILRCCHRTDSGSIPSCNGTFCFNDKVCLENDGDAFL